MIITLTTDFGLSDPFVGIMKGVILGIAPDVQIVDISHDVQAYDVLQAALVIDSAYPYFPDRTVHVVVVDPGVGSARRPIAAISHGQIFIAPDNGALTTVLGDEVHAITNETVFLSSVSRTFHGRDIFAPAAAHVARGMPVRNLGPSIQDFIKHPVPQPTRIGDKLLATVLRVDKFGNLITNLRRRDLNPNFTIRVAGRPVKRLCLTFSEAKSGELFALEGSTGYIEIAMNQDSAAEMLQVRQGAEIEVETGIANH